MRNRICSNNYTFLSTIFAGFTNSGKYPFIEAINKVAGFTLFAGIFLFIFSMYGSAFFSIAAKTENELMPYSRTRLGKSLNKKVEGLKRYLEEFSTLEDKSKDAITIWDDYLIYSVIFGKNTKIVDEYLEKLN